jgi:SAM-dependent methyltransferase
LRPWHFQWLSAHFLNRDLRHWLPLLRGRVLDVGCGRRPYQALLSGADEVISIDVAANPRADVRVAPDASWPFAKGSFDVVLMTQVMEYVDDVGTVMAEIHRVLKPGGRAVVSFPFLYNEHGMCDRLRLTARRTFAEFNVLAVVRQGGFGSTLTILTLNWLDTMLNHAYPLRLLRPLLLPVWLPFCLCANVAGLAVNRLDRTRAFYSNVFLVLSANEPAPFA